MKDKKNNKPYLLLTENLAKGSVFFLHQPSRKITKILLYCMVATSPDKS